MTAIAAKPAKKISRGAPWLSWRFAIQALTFSGFIAQGVLYYKLNFRPLGNLLPFMAFQSLGHQVISSALLIWGIIFFLTLIFGRLVCGWLCPIGFIQDAGEKLLRALKIEIPPATRQARLPRYLLAAMVLIQFAVLPILASPVHLWKFDLNYQEPWLLGFPFNTLLFCVDLLAIFLVVGIILPMHLGPRPYCKLVCETGLLLDRVSQFSFGRVRRNHGFDRNVCIDCRKCTNSCPQAIDVFEEVHNFDQVVNSDCISCMECIQACPVDTIVYSLRKQLRDAGKVHGYLAKVRMKPEDLPRYLLTGIGVVLGGWIGFLKMPPSYFHTYLLFASMGGIAGWGLWHLIARLAGGKEIEANLQASALSQVEREATAGIDPLSNKEKFKYQATRPGRRWIGIGITFSFLSLAGLVFMIVQKVPPRILLVDEIAVEQATPEARNAKKIFHLGVPPVLEMNQLQIAYRDLQLHLDRGMSRDVRFITAGSYGELGYALETGKIDAAFLPPLAYLSLKHRLGNSIKELLMTENHGKKSYQGLILVRDSKIARLEDLKGKRIALTSADSLSGFAAPMALFRGAGLSNLDFTEMVMAGNHGKAIDFLVKGRVDAVATYEGPFEEFRKQHPEIDLKVLATIPDLPNDVLVSSTKLNDDSARRLQESLKDFLDPAKRIEGSNLEQLGITAFIPFDPAGYQALETLFTN